MPTKLTNQKIELFKEVQLARKGQAISVEQAKVL